MSEYSIFNPTPNFVSPIKSTTGSSPITFNPTLQHTNPSFSPQGQMHDVVLDHLKVGDEVVWLPDGRPVSIHTLDIGRVSHTLYHVNETSQETLLAIVDFHDWVEGSQEVRNTGGGRSFRLRVYVKHLKRLGEFLESANSGGVTNGKGIKGPLSTTSYNPPTSSVGRVPRSYVVRPCVLSSKRQASHPLITEMDQIYVYFNNVVTQGLVRRLFVGDGNNLFIGAEFNGTPVYPQQLAHSPSCNFLNNGCESRIGIQISNLTKHIWESEFRLIVNGTKHITFEDLFYKEEAPPSYSAVISSTPYLQPPTPSQNMPMPHEINYFPPPATAPPLTPSPPPPVSPQSNRVPQKWEQFPVSPPFKEKVNPDFGNQDPPGFQPLSRNYSASMMNLDLAGNQKPSISARPSATPNRKSLLVDELKRKLKIEPTKPQLEAYPSPIQTRDQFQPQFDSTTPESLDTTLQITQPRRISQNPESKSFLDELKRRQQGRTSRPASMEPTNLSVVSENKPEPKPQRLSLPPKPTPIQDRSPVQPQIKNGYKRSEFALPFPTKTNLTTGGMTRATSCMDISELKPTSTPKPRPILAPKPLRSTTPKPAIQENQFVFRTPENNSKPPPSPIPPLPPRPTKSDQNQNQSLQQNKIPPQTTKVQKEPEAPPLLSNKPLPQWPPFSQKEIQQPEITRPNPTHSSPPNLPPPVKDIAPETKSQIPVLPVNDNPVPLLPIKSKLYPDLSSESFPTPSKTVYEPTRPPTPVQASLPINPNPQNYQEPEEVVSSPPPPPSQDTQPEVKPVRNAIISRDNLPPPPPPPPPTYASPSESNSQLYPEDDEADYPPPPPEMDSHDSGRNVPSSPVPAKDTHCTRGGLLQQIREGIKLRPAVNTDDVPDPIDHQPSTSRGGFENIIKGAIASRRVMVDSDEESNQSDYDEDSDAWD